jgi:capsular polysaccharide transport system ATP-binding protein
VIEFRNVSKYYPTPGGRKTVLNQFSQVIPAGSKVALLGRNGAGKSTMIGMISGKITPNSGSIRYDGLMSWPLGFRGSFAPEMSGAQNTRFVARIYGIDTDYLVDYVSEFADLGDFLYMPVRTYSSGMKARLAFGLAMGVAFDWYLVDEVTAVGDAAFRRKSLRVFKTRLARAGLLMVSHATSTLRDYCDCGIVLDGGQAQFYPDIAEALARHEENMAIGAEPTTPRRRRALRQLERATQSDARDD